MLFSVDVVFGIVDLNPLPSVDGVDITNAAELFNTAGSTLSLEDGANEAQKLDSELTLFELSVSEIAGIGDDALSVGILGSSASPVLEHNIITLVADGGAVPITRSQLTVSDADSAPTELTYTVTTGPAGGFVAYTDNRFASISTFTQQDIDDGRLIYVNTTAAVNDSFEFSVTDGNTDSTALIGTFTLEIQPSVAPTLSSGVELNYDGGNDAYLQSNALGFSNLNASTVEVIFSASPLAAIVPLVEIADGSAKDISISIDTVTGNLLLNVGSSAAFASTAMDYSAELLDEKKHSVALTWNGENQSVFLYIDGNKVDDWSNQSTGVILDLTSSTLTLGQPASSSAITPLNQFSGNYYDVRLWDYVRSASEISLMHDKKFLQSDARLIANWQMQALSVQGTVLDQNGTNPLFVKHAMGAGFSHSEVRTDLNVYENSATGTSVGHVLVHEGEHLRSVVSDGDFTDAGVPASSNNYAAGDTLGAWGVSGGSVDLLRADGAYSDNTLTGGNSVRLNVVDAAVSQTLSTEPGRLYQLNYSVGGDFSTNAASIAVEAVFGSQVQNTTVDLTSVGGNDPWSLSDNMLWRNQSLIIAAENLTTALQFKADTPGVMIADVRVEEIPLEIATVLAGQANMVYDSVTNKFYKTSSHQSIYSGALNYAASQKIDGVASRLVVIDSAYENAIVSHAQSPLGDSVWIGATDDVDEGQWNWNYSSGESELFWQGAIDGSAVNGAYTNWKANEPNDYQSNGGEDYGVLEVGGYWNDEPVTTGLNYIVVEWDVSEVLNSYQFQSVLGSGFSIDSETGEVTVDGSSVIDYESTQSRTMPVDIIELDGDSYANTIDIDVNNVNEAPAGIDNTISILEEDIYTFSALDFGFTDPESNGLAAIFIDTLPSNGALELNGSAVSVGQQVAASQITNLTYTAGLNDGAGDDIEFRIIDDGGTVATGVDTDPTANKITIDIIAVNDPPVGYNPHIGIDEDETYYFSAADFPFTDVENNALLSVTIHRLPTEGQLNLAGLPVSAGDVINQADIPTLSFTPPLNAIQTPTPIAGGPVQGAFAYQITDDGGTANGGEDTEASWHAMFFDITSVNDAPQAIDKTISTLEDTPYEFNLTDFLYSDVESHNVLNIIVTALPTNGELVLGGVPVLVGQSVNVTAISLLEFIPEPGMNGLAYDSFEYLLQDDGGTANGGNDTDLSGKNITIDVVSVNDAPMGADNTLHGIEDKMRYFTAADFGFTDPDNDSFMSLIIETLPQDGQLTYTGAPVSVGDEIAYNFIHELGFQAAPNEFGAAYTQFEFSVRDDGGVFNGGSDNSIATNVITLDIDPVNDPPSGSDATVVVLEDTPRAFSAAEFGFSDVIDNHGLKSVVINTLPTNGQLLISGTPVTPGQAIDAASIALLEFVPEVNANGTGYDSFTFRVQDNGGVLNSGENTDPLANTMIVDLTSVNDAPLAADNTVVTTEDTEYAFNAVEFGFNDPIDGDRFQSIIIEMLPASGQLLLLGGNVTVGQEISVASLSDLSYMPPLGANGIAFDAFDFRVRDDGGVTDGGADSALLLNRIAIDVNEANDAPNGTDATLVSLEDIPYQFAISDFGFTDIDGNNFESVIITTLPADGDLQLSGTPVTSSQLIPVASIPLLEFIPQTNVNGAGYDSFTFQVQDDGGVLNGGVDTDLVANQITFDIASVNDAPAGADNTLTTLEDTPLQFTAADFRFRDSDNDEFMSVVIESLPANGLLTLSGTPITSGLEIPRSSIADLGFVADPNDSAQAYATFEFSVRDNGGATSGGIEKSIAANVMTIDVASVNDAPAGSDSTIDLLEDTPHSFTALDFGFSDVSDNNNLSAVIITALPVNGALELAGMPVTSGQVIAVADIPSLQFVPALHENGIGYDTISFKVQDDGLTINGGTDIDETANQITINVASVNDVPSASDTTLITTEDTPLLFATTDFGFSDINDGDQFAAVIIESVPTSGQLFLSGVPVMVGQAIPVSELPTLSYTPPIDVNGVAVDDMDFRVQDNGGTADGGVDISLQVHSISIDVRGSNDAPEGADTVVTLNEDTAYQFSGADFGFVDTDGHNFQSVTITSVPVRGQLHLSGVVVTAGQMIAASSIAALEFVPPANANGASFDSFTFQVQDDGGVINGGVNIDPMPNTVSVDVTSVNDSPVGGNKTVSTFEDTPYVFSATDFEYADIENHTLLNVIITSLPVNGLLTLAGVPVAPGQAIGANDIGALVFTPESHVNGIGYDTFSFVIQDAGGSANGGIDTDLLANDITINIVSVNDAPVGADGRVTMNEDSIYSFTAADFGSTDIDNNSLLSVVIDMLPANGQLILSGVPVQAGQSVVNINDLKYISLPDAHGIAHDSFTFRVQDDGGTENGGVDTDPATNTMVVDVVSVNDAPTGTDNSVTTTEDAPYTFVATDFGFTDSDNNALAAITITAVPANAQLLLAGAPVVPGQVIDVAQIPNLQLLPEPNVHGIGYDSLGFTVTDDGGSLNGGLDTGLASSIITMDVLSVNDAPAGTDNTVYTPEDTDYIFKVNDFGYTDPDANALQEIVISALPANGQLTLFGTPVNLGQSITANQVANLVFTPEPDESQIAYASFEFNVRDDGGTLYNGKDTDPVAKTITINVGSANNAPIGDEVTATTLEDIPYSFDATDFGFSDADNNNLAAVIIESVPVNGTLSLAGAPVVIGQVVPASDITDVRYTPNANAYGSVFDAFQFYVMDDGGTDNNGIDTALQPNTWSIDVLSVNDAPVTSTSTVSALEDTAYAFAANDFSFNDIDANNLQQIVIQTLPTSGNLSLQGLSVVVGQAIDVADIENLSYLPAADIYGVAQDTFEYMVRDDGGTANGGIDISFANGAINIDVVPVNDAPIGSASEVEIIEDTPYAFNVADFIFTDVESHSLDSIIITALPVSGVLEFNDNAVAVGQVINATMITDLIYTPPVNANGAAVAAFDYLLRDAGGSAAGGQDISVTESTMTVNVVSVNDAPVGIESVVEAQEDTPYQFAASNFGFSDAESHQLKAIVLSALPGYGALTLSGLPVVPNQIVDVADVALLEYLPEPHGNGQYFDALSYQVIDKGGTANGGVDTAVLDSVMHINVASVNDWPVGADTTITMLEDTVYKMYPTDFGFSDVYDSDLFQAVRIDTLPVNGELTSAGARVQVGQLIPHASLQAGELQFTPLADESGAVYSEIEFSVIDNGGIGSGGQNTNQQPNILSLNVLPVSDAPQSTDALIEVLEDTPYIFTANNFAFYDPGDSDTLDFVIIESLPASGILQLAGADVVVGQSVSAADLVNGNFIYQPEANTYGTELTTFTYRVQDTGDLSNGGSNLSVNPYSILLDVLAVNDAPQGQSTVIEISESATRVIQPTDFGFTDDNHQLAGVLVTQIPQAGSLLLNSEPVAVGEVVSVSDLNAGILVYSAPLNVDAAGATARMGFKVIDNGGVSVDGVDTDLEDRFIDFDLIAVNSEPTLALTDATFDEGSTNAVDTSFITATDIDDNSEELFLSVLSSPNNGTLMLDGSPITNGATFTVAQLENNELYYIHDGSETESDTFQLLLADGGEDGSQPVVGEFKINIAEVLDPAPELIDDTIAVDAGQESALASVIENDLLAANDNYTIALETNPEFGSVTFNTDGTFSYTHDGSAEYQDSFSYRVTNSDGIYQVATVLVNVEPPVGAATDAATEAAIAAAIEAALEDSDLLVEEDNEEQVKDEEEQENEVQLSNQPDAFVVDSGLSIDLPEADAFYRVETESQVDSVVFYQEDVETFYSVRVPVRTLDAYQTLSHNQNETISFSSLANSDRSNLFFDLQVNVSNFKDVTDNYYFQDALARVDRELENANEQKSRSYALGSEAVFGVSLSATAGVLAWALRGGALFAGMMAATPLWSSIDPVRVMVGSSKEEDDAEEESVEKLFE